MIEQFLTWGDLVTYGGAVMAVLINTGAVLSYKESSK